MKIRRIPADTVPPSMTWQDALRAAKAYWRAKRQQFNKDFQKWKSKQKVQILLTCIDTY